MEPCGAYLRFFLFLSVPLPSKKFKNNKNNNKRERTEQKKKSAGEDVVESESLGKVKCYSPRKSLVIP